MRRNGIFWCTTLAGGICSALLLVLGSGPALADSLQPIELGAVVGGHISLGDNELGAYDDDPEEVTLSHAPALGLRAGITVIPHLAVEGEMVFMPAGVNNADASMNIFGWRAQVLGYLFDGKPLQPFALLGVGTLNGFSSNQDLLYDDTDAEFHLGLGAKYHISEDWGLRLDARGLFVPSASSDSLSADVEVLASAYLRFCVMGCSAKCAPHSVPDEAVEDTMAVAGNAGEIDKATWVKMMSNDSDEDSVPNGKDICPCEKEDQDGFQDEDGCPEQDNDSDGVLDQDDQCPEESGPQNQQGCPDPLPQDMQGLDQTAQGIKFEFNSDELRVQSYPRLDQIASLLQKHRSIVLEVSGHSDEVGTKLYNQQLSQRRADAVRSYLISKGVDSRRLKAKGYGRQQPINRDNTAEARAENRRVEFKILRR